jgi:lipopolysaccharide biosynthesis glycosyltransferase
LRFLADHPATPYADQDALNVALDANWVVLADEWNFQGHISTRISRLHQPPAIVHFITGAKPWLREHGTPNEGLYDSYRRKTRFARGATDYVSDLRKMHGVLWKRLSRKVLRVVTAAGAR